MMCAWSGFLLLLVALKCPSLLFFRSAHDIPLVSPQINAAVVCVRSPVGQRAIIDVFLSFRSAELLEREWLIWADKG